MNVDTGEPLDTFLPDTKAWLKSIGSKAKTLSEIIATRDPLVSNCPVIFINLL